MRFLLGLFLTVLAYNANALEFVNLKDDQAVRANNGVLRIEVQSDVGYGILMDGRLIGVGPHGQPTVHMVRDVDRGTHTLTLREGSEVRREITIHVLRVNKNFP